MTGKNLARGRGLGVALAALLAGSLLACNKAEPGQASGAQSAGGEAFADGDPCALYEDRLCEALGPRSASCAAAMAVVAVLPPRACSVGMQDWQATEERIAALRGQCQQVADRVCTAVGEESEACRAIRTELPSIAPGHCPSLLRDADQLIARVLERERMNQPLDGERWARVAQGGGPEFGAADASVVLVEFSDFECPYCARAAETVRKVKQAYGERIRFVFRQFPLPFHRNAHGAAQASLAAHRQGKFWEYHDLLFDNQDALEPEALRTYAQQLGLDMAKFDADAGGQATASAVADDLQLGESVHVRGTPTLFINGKRVDNALDYDAVAAEIDAALGVD